MKQEFLTFINKLMDASPEIVEKYMTEDVKEYLNFLAENSIDSKPEITDNGKVILAYLQEREVSMLKARDIAEGLSISSRSISGSMRKLVSDGFVEKIGKDPAVYRITEKGKKYNIIKGENENEENN